MKSTAYLNIIGLNYTKYFTFNKGGLDNLEITLPNNEQNRIERFKISELKAFFFRESLDKVFERVINN